MYIKKPKVDFMIIGAQKSATTSLFDILKKHPQLAACKKKEPEFFSHTIDWKNKVDIYESMFTKEPNHLAFEASTAYTAHPFYNRSIWEELYEYNPNLKFIYIVRDPLDRIQSAHRFLYRQGYTHKKNINSYINNSEYYTVVSKYYFQIKPYIDRFGEKNVKIILFEDFVATPKTVIKTILDFLEVQPFMVNTYIRQKSNTKNRALAMKTGFTVTMRFYQKIKHLLPYRIAQKIDKKLMYRSIEDKDLTFTSKTREQLAQELIPDINKFEELIQRDLSNWKLNLKVDKQYE